MTEWAATFGAKFNEQESTFKASFGTVYWIDPHPLPDPYEGPYEVIPKVVDQTLPTNGKRMEYDVTVTEISYAEVGNMYGTTVTIAS